MIGKCKYNGADILWEKQLDLFVERHGVKVQRYQEFLGDQYSTEIRKFRTEILSTKLRELPMCTETQQPVEVMVSIGAWSKLRGAFYCPACHSGFSLWTI